MLLFLRPYCSTKIILFGPKLGLKVITTPFGSPSSKYGTYMNPIDQQQTKPLSTLLRETLETSNKLPEEFIENKVTFVRSIYQKWINLDSKN